jgi:hypothetical protein
MLMWFVSGRLFPPLQGCRRWPSKCRTCSRAWPMKVLVLACVWTAATSATNARAAAGHWQAGARLGAAWLDAASIGPSLEGYLRRGLTESLDLDLQVLSSFHPFAAGDSAQNDDAATDAWAFSVSPGVLYRWDVLRAVPYAGVGAGLYEWSGELEPAVKSAQFGVSARLGLDYLVSRDVVLSVQACSHWVSADGLRMPWFQLGIGAAHAWGW